MDGVEAIQVVAREPQGEISFVITQPVEADDVGALLMDAYEEFDRQRLSR